MKLFLVEMAKFRDARFNSPVSMVASLEKVLATAEVKGRRIPIAGLRQAAHDMVAWSRTVPAELTREADAHLKKRGSLTLTAMINRVSSIVPRVLKRGRIRNDEEFYVMKELLNDVAHGLAGRDRDRAEKLVGAFESRSGPQLPARRLTTG